jgi:hypothetical protein
MAQVLEEKVHEDAGNIEAIPSSDDEVSIKSPEEKALVRKIDMYLMPSIWFLYLLAVSRSKSFNCEKGLTWIDSTWTAQTLAMRR